MHEPRDPPLKVITSHLQHTNSSLQTCALAHKKDAFGAGRGLAGGPTVYRLPDARYRRAPRKHIRFTRDCTQAVPVAYSQVSVMILPQVHLRKPCYDFYFLQKTSLKPLLGGQGRANPADGADPKFSRGHPVGSSDGRCVQRAGT